MTCRSVCARSSAATKTGSEPCCSLTCILLSLSLAVSEIRPLVSAARGSEGFVKLVAAAVGIRRTVVPNLAICEKS